MLVLEATASLPRSRFLFSLSCFCIQFKRAILSPSRCQCLLEVRGQQWQSLGQRDLAGLGAPTDPAFATASLATLLLRRLCEHSLGRRPGPPTLWLPSQCLKITTQMHCLLIFSPTRWWWRRWRWWRWHQYRPPRQLAQRWWQMMHGQRRLCCCRCASMCKNKCQLSGRTVCCWCQKRRPTFQSSRG